MSLSGLILLLTIGCGADQDDTRAPPPSPAKPAALPDRFGLGRAATPAEIAAWDIDVDPSGASLPPGQGTVAQGEELYRARCAACHGLQGEGGIGPALIGPQPKTGFGEDPTIKKTIGNWWPYATTIFDYVRRAMPQTQPGSLTDDETYALVAWLLHRNEVVPAEFVATAEAVRAVKMPVTVTFVEDDREGTSQVR